MLSSQIEGPQSSLADLLLYEIDEQPGVPVEDAREVSRCVADIEAPEVRELTNRQRGRVFSYHRYIENLNAELEPSL